MSAFHPVIFQLHSNWRVLPSEMISIFLQFNLIFRNILLSFFIKTVFLENFEDFTFIYFDGSTRCLMDHKVKCLFRIFID